MEGHNARLSRQSFVFRHPISGEVKEGLGEIPLPWGEYPQGVEPNSEMGDAYDLNRGLFRPLPDSLFKPEALTEIQKKPEGSQLDDPYWATASKILHDYLKPDQEAEMTSDDYANYGVRFISSFENNIGAMAVNTVKLSGAPTPVHKAMYYLLETGDRDGITASGFGRAASNMAKDPFNWLGLATFGIGTAGKMAGQKLSKMAFKDLLKEIVISKPTKASVALGAEGAVFAAADDLARQNVAVAADVQDAIDPTEAAISGVTGAVLGERLGAGGGAAIESVARALRNYAAGAPARVAERQSGTTLASGVDPTAMIDDIITAQARYFETGKFEPPTAENPVSVVKPTEQEPGIIAFHGSGADFDEFRLEMVGTGEGAQAYGYGLYFTDSEDIANFYRQTVGGGTRIVDFSIGNLDLVRSGEFRDYSPGAMPFGRDRRYRRVQDLTAEDYAQASMIEDIFINGNRLFNEIKTPGAGVIYEPKKGDELKDELINIINETLNGKDPTDQPGEVAYLQNIVKSVARGDATIKLDTEQYGKTYKVGLAPKPDELLDYDLPITEQPKKVQDALFANDEIAMTIQRKQEDDGLVPEFYTGQELLQDLAENLLSAQAASMELSDAGILGLKYRAAGSRGATTTDEAAARNYVIFDDKAVKILEKYGIVGPVAVTAGAASQTDTEADDGNT